MMHKEHTCPYSIDRLTSVAFHDRVSALLVCGHHFRFLVVVADGCLDLVCGMISTPMVAQFEMPEKQLTQAEHTKAKPIIILHKPPFQSLREHSFLLSHAFSLQYGCLCAQKEREAIETTARREKRRAAKRVQHTLFPSGPPPQY